MQKGDACKKMRIRFTGEVYIVKATLGEKSCCVIL